MKIAVSLAAAFALAAVNATVASAQGRPDTPSPHSFVQDNATSGAKSPDKTQDMQNRSRDMQNPLQTGRDVQNRETTAPKQSRTDMQTQDHHQRMAQHRADRSHSYARDRRHRRSRAYMLPPPPRGWHHYERRPWDWRHRGCYRAGPVWVCR